MSNGGQQSAWEHVLYLAQSFGFARVAVGRPVWTGSRWAAVGVHGGFHIGNHLATGRLRQVDAVIWRLAIRGVQTVIGLVLIVTALRRGKHILDSES